MRSAQVSRLDDLKAVSVQAEKRRKKSQRDSEQFIQRRDPSLPHARLRWVSVECRLMPKPPEIASELDEMKMNQRDKDVIFSNNRIKSGLTLNLSCVSGSVLASMLLMEPLEKPFSAKCWCSQSQPVVTRLCRQSARQADIESSKGLSALNLSFASVPSRMHILTFMPGSYVIVITGINLAGTLCVLKHSQSFSTTNPWFCPIRRQTPALNINQR